MDATYRVNIRWCNCSVMLCILPLYAAEGTKRSLTFEVQENSAFFFFITQIAAFKVLLTGLSYSLLLFLVCFCHIHYILESRPIQGQSVSRFTFWGKKKSNVMSSHFLSWFAVITVIMIPHKFPGTVMVKLGKTKTDFSSYHDDVDELPENQG